MSPASIDQHHAEWLNLVEYSGPFLTQPVLKRAFPQGLEPTDPGKVEELRRAHKEWEEDSDLHGLWIRWVMRELLALDHRVLVEGPRIPAGLSVAIPEHGETLRPDLAVVEPDKTSQARLLVTIWPEGTRLERKLPDTAWAATPIDRLTELLKGTGVRLGLSTDGERWTLAHVPESGAPAYASWEAGIWLEERVTLDAFVSVLRADRFFAAAETDTLEALFAESANAEAEVTDQLGKQVKQAVELLVAAFSRANRERGGELLKGVDDHEVYLSAVTVMMRIVFLLSAEERGLFLLGDPLYDESYAISTLLGQLERQAEFQGEEPLQYRSAAWHRVLGTFRLVHEGVQHEDLRLPPYGGSLFDPERFPFLEGRSPADPPDVSRPLPVDDRTMLHILDAVQVLRFRGRGGRLTEARRLTFAALDVEQIGHVYEGLLDHDAVWVMDPAVGIEGKREPEIALQIVEDEYAKGRKSFVEWLAEEADRTPKSVEKALDGELDANARARLLTACENDRSLSERVTPFLGLLREDLRGLPLVFLPASVYVTRTSERRSSGTYYTPRTLAEEVVEHALAPLVYQPGPAEEKDREKWMLKPPMEILKLKVCDMAMGSGAFLVAACRYLADRLIESWERIDDDAITPLGRPASGTDLTVPDDPEDRALLARRLIADRCLYGVDRNPMAVEMAKLSMWLITLAKDRPFSFLDHALKVGDSLLGVTSLDQIEYFHMVPARGKSLYERFDVDWDMLRGAVKTAVERRRELESFPVVTLRDAETKRRLEREAMEEVRPLGVVADALIGAALSTAGDGDVVLDGRLVNLAPDVAAALDVERKEADRLVRLQDLRDQAIYMLDEGNPDTKGPRHPFQWPVEFPEVFVDHGGFDAIVGNPPFQGGKKVSGAHGTDFREHLVEHVASGTKGNADLIAYFLLRSAVLLRGGGVVGMLATNTVSQGDTREVGLDQLVATGMVVARAWKSRPWPGDASLEIGQVWLRQGGWEGRIHLDDREVAGIGPSLDPKSRVEGPANRLVANAGKSFQGSIVLGMGFVLAPEEAEELLAADAASTEVVKPYLNGEDLNSRPDLSPSRWVIDFDEMLESEARIFSSCWELVEERVKPERMTKDASKYPRMVKEWWKFWNTRPGLYSAIEGRDLVIAIPRVTKHIVPAFVSASAVFADRLVVFAYDDYRHFGLLSSHIHVLWVLARSATFETRPTYNPTDCFETFPQPGLTDDIGRVAQALDEHRRATMLDRDEGLTKIYNRVNDPGEKSEDVMGLRKLQVELDHAVAQAYGWHELALKHDFHDTPQGIRYTPDPEVRIEVLDRLLELNHERYAEEVAAGLHGRKVGGRRGAGQTSLIEN